jgi:hypothetical protein
MFDHSKAKVDIIYRAFKEDGTLRNWYGPGNYNGFFDTLDDAKWGATRGKSGHVGLRTQKYRVYMFHIGVTEDNYPYFKPQLVYEHIAACK